MASGLRLVHEMASGQDVCITTGRHLRLWAVGLVFVLATACSRQGGVLPLTQPVEASHDLPFNRSSQESGLSPTQAIATVALPVGTPIVIRLKSPLTSAATHSGDAFEAVLDEPILVQGQVLVQRGVTVRGRVAAAKPLDAPIHPGYLRLTLSSIAYRRDSLTVHTSSIFAKGSLRKLGEKSILDPGIFSRGWLVRTNEVGSAAQLDDGDAKISTAQRLTFRLLGPLTTAQ